MRFEPKTEAQLKAELLLPAGDYDFTIIEAEEKQSAKGNDMIALKLLVYTPDGGERTIRDWLMAGSIKLCQFCVGVQLDHLYEQGVLTDQDCVGRSGRATIAIEEDKTGQYGPQNKVKAYLVAKAAKPAPARTAPPASARRLTPDPAPAFSDNNDAPF